MIYLIHIPNKDVFFTPPRGRYWPHEHSTLDLLATRHPEATLINIHTHSIDHHTRTKISLIPKNAINFRFRAEPTPLAWQQPALRSTSAVASCVDDRPCATLISWTFVTCVWFLDTVNHDTTQSSRRNFATLNWIFFDSI